MRTLPDSSPEPARHRRRGVPSIVTHYAMHALSLMFGYSGALWMKEAAVSPAPLVVVRDTNGDVVPSSRVILVDTETSERVYICPYGSGEPLDAAHQYRFSSDFLAANSGSHKRR